jgi:hypothetical protein
LKISAALRGRRSGLDTVQKVAPASKPATAKYDSA